MHGCAPIAARFHCEQPSLAHQFLHYTMPLFHTLQPRYAREMPPKIPAPSHRHAAPSGPWPWMDLESEIDPTQLAPGEPHTKFTCSHDDEKCARCWSKYPQSLFPNWTLEQQKRSRIAKTVKNRETCVIHHVDVGNDGKFLEAEMHSVSEDTMEMIWQKMQQKRPDSVRVRALFIENLSGPVLQMLGTKYNIEPFYFSSSLNWIPSRFQEDLRPTQGDHITITLTFIRTIRNPMTAPPSPTSSYAASTIEMKPQIVNQMIDTQVIDTQAPLSLRSSDRILLPDLLAIHMVRSSTTSNTIISYHPTHEWRTTSARHLHSRVHFAGQSVFWQKLFQKSNDPTFVLLSILWYALYAWDEALETLYIHVCYLESQVISTNDMQMTQDLHTIRAHLLHYSSLLEDFRKSVVFLIDTPNPAMDDPKYSESERTESRALLKKECDNLLSEIDRLEKGRKMQDKRLKNVMNLAFSLVNIEDSKRTQKLTEATVRDSAAMKQISYLTMIFLPASFVATVFGMNIQELAPDTLGTLPHYFETVIPITIVTVWVIVAFQMRSKYTVDEGDGESEGNGNVSVWMRVWWPVFYVAGLFRRKRAGGGKGDV